MKIESNLSTSIHIYFLKCFVLVFGTFGLNPLWVTDYEQRARLQSRDKCFGDNRDPKKYFCDFVSM